MPFVKLSDEQVRTIRERRANGENQQDIADDFKIRQSTVSQIVTGRKRKTAGGPIAEARPHKRKGK